LALPFGVADPAFSALLHLEKVVSRVGVTLRAMHLTRIATRPAVAPKVVLFLSDGLQVIGVDAPAVAALVVEEQSIRDGAYKALVRPPVNQDIPPSAILRVGHVGVPGFG
jgi:hypothetical protein